MIGGRVGLDFLDVVERMLSKFASILNVSSSLHDMLVEKKRASSAKDSYKVFY